MKKTNEEEIKNVAVCYPFIRVFCLTTDKPLEDNVDWESLGINRPSDNEIDLKDCFYSAQYFDRYDVSRIIAVDDKMCTIMFKDGSYSSIKGEAMELVEAIAEFDMVEIDIEVEKSIAIEKGKYGEEEYEI